MDGSVRKSADGSVKKIITALICAYISSAAIYQYFIKGGGTTTGSDITLWIMLLLLPLNIKASSITDKGVKGFSVLLGLLAALSYTLVKAKGIVLGQTDMASAVLYFAGFFLMFKNIAAVLGLLAKKHGSINTLPPRTGKKDRIRFFFAVLGVILLLRLPMFLFYFPGNLTYDSVSQLSQIMGEEPYTNHHPFFHTMCVKLAYDIGTRLFGGIRGAVACYSIGQCVFLSACFAYAVEELYALGLNKKILAVTAAYYCFMPYHADYSFTMWKDVPFAAVMLVLAVVIFKTVYLKNIGCGDIAVFVIFGLAACLLRSNGFYAFLFFVPFAAVWYMRRDKRLVLAAVLVVCAAFIIKGPIYAALGVGKASCVETVSIPIQQISCVIANGGELTAEQQALLSEVVDIDKVKTEYLSVYADPIKYLIWGKGNEKYITDNKARFFKLWAQLGLKYPALYLTAHIEQTYGYWYPDVQYWIYSLDAPVGGNKFKDYRLPLLPYAVQVMIVKLFGIYKAIPVLGIFFSIGAAMWLFVASAAVCALRSNKKYLIAYIPVLAVMLTLMLATPVYAEFRYAYSLFTAMPLFCVIPFFEPSKQ